MPKRKPSDMRLMSLEEQREVQQRLANRREATEAMKRLNAALLAFLDGDKVKLKAFIGAFTARGHHGQYHEFPNDTARRRQLAAQVTALVRETPLNWMKAVELSYNVMRFNAIIEVLDALSPGDLTLKEILQVYEDVGDAIRQQIYTETGHWPEEFPPPHDRMTGDESDDLFELGDYQPRLFDEGV